MPSGNTGLNLRFGVSFFVLFGENYLFELFEAILNIFLVQ